jgi:hypothetical protein
MDLWAGISEPEAADPAARRRQRDRDRSRQYRRRNAFCPPVNVDAPPPQAVIDAVGVALGEALATKFQIEMAEHRSGVSQTESRLGMSPADQQQE